MVKYGKMGMDPTLRAFAAGAPRLAWGIEPSAVPRVEPTVAPNNVGHSRGICGDAVATVPAR